MRGNSMQTSIRDLRNNMKAVFNAVQRGEEVIVYSHKKPLAKITRITEKNTRPFENIGFGMWSDDSDMQDVSAYARKLRKGRNHDR
jgi:antitoxin (DNA-binding transcriptional repressor) of toxin-antitoxin stability system